jgi:hypothetical protein
MKRSIVLMVALFAVMNIFSQGKYMTKSGFISFYSHTPLEDIKADNNQVASIYDSGSGEIVFNVLIKSFKFDRALMEEHFNENYIESDKFPKASFKGKVNNASSIDLKKDGTYPAEVEGDMTIHGVTKHVKTNGTFEVKDGKIHGKSKFQIDPTDYGIVIPSVVKNKFADKFEVTVDMNYASFEKK